MSDWIQTFTGRKFWPLDPRVEDVCLEDIAHALSNACRFNGHTRCFYSVAEHSVFVAMKAPLKHRLAALMHDASEAYLCDLPRPVKHNVVGYAEAENRVMNVIAQKFGFDLPLDPIIKELDNRIIADEREMLLAKVKWSEDDKAKWEAIGPPLGVQLRGWLPADAEQAFLQTYYTLGEPVVRV